MYQHELTLVLGPKHQHQCKSHTTVGFDSDRGHFSQGVGVAVGKQTRRPPERHGEGVGEGPRRQQLSANAATKADDFAPEKIPVEFTEAQLTI